MCDLALLFTLLVAMPATSSSLDEESLPRRLLVCPDTKPTALPSMTPWLAQAVNSMVAWTYSFKRRASEFALPFPGLIGEAGISSQ